MMPELNWHDFIRQLILDKTLVEIIKEKFGDEFVFETTHGTLIVDRKVIRKSKFSLMNFFYLILFMESIMTFAMASFFIFSS